MMWILKEEVKSKIKSDPDLFRDLCKILKKSPYTLPDLLRKNDDQLTQKAALVAISKGLGIPENELTEEVAAVDRIK